MPYLGKCSKFGKILRFTIAGMKKTALFLLLSVCTVRLLAQGNLSGDLMMNANFFQLDSSINAVQSPLYDKYLSGGEGWLSLRYNYKGFTAFLRADAFHNSNLYDPKTAISGFGIGAWSLSKEINNLTITGGYIYDQIGSGILFRAYEDRGLLIDNALVGLHLKYKLNDHITLKGFTGQQKNVRNFSRFEPIIKGINAEGEFSIGKVNIVPGIGALNRTLDQNSMDAIVSTINSYELKGRFVPKYNTYAFTAYNMLTAGDVSWYVEGAYKTEEALKANFNSDSLTFHDGSVLYSTLGYARKGIAVNLTGKRTENFILRTSPNENPPRGNINWQPIVARLRPQRLMARYTPASQDISEMAFGADVLLSPSEALDVTLNYTHINTLTDVKLFREIYGEVNYRGLESWIFQGGVQVMEYNSAIYQFHPGMVEAVTPFVEVTYKFDNKRSLRGEVQYMSTEQDFGSLLFVLLEYNIAPNWSFAASDMYTMDLNPENVAGIKDPQHFYNFFIAYNKGPHRFSAAYVKQVEGINCTGGVCRYEPAFSGLKLMITSSF